MANKSPAWPVWRGRAQLIGSLRDAPRPGLPGARHASSAITVLELRCENPPEAPHYCWPDTTQVHLHPQGHTDRLLWASASRGTQIGDQEPLSPDSNDFGSLETFLEALRAATATS